MVFFLNRLSVSNRYDASIGFFPGIWAKSRKSVASNLVFFLDRSLIESLKGFERAEDKNCEPKEAERLLLVLRWLEVCGVWLLWLTMESDLDELDRESSSKLRLRGVVEARHFSGTS